MNIYANILNKVLTNWIQEQIKNSMHYDEGASSLMQGSAYICKSFNVIDIPH